MPPRCQAGVEGEDPFFGRRIFPATVDCKRSHSASCRHLGDQATDHNVATILAHSLLAIRKEPCSFYYIAYSLGCTELNFIS